MGTQDVENFASASRIRWWRTGHRKVGAPVQAGRLRETQPVGLHPLLLAGLHRRSFRHRLKCPGVAEPSAFGYKVAVAPMKAAIGMVLKPGLMVYAVLPKFSPRT